MRGRVAGMALALGLLVTGSAGARPLPDGGVNASEVAAVLRDRGYKAEIGTDSVGDPIISSALEGTNYKILFYGCSKEKRCTSIQFSAGFDLADGMTLAAANRWNKEKRFGRVYLDDEGDPFVQLDLDLERGGTTEAVANYLATWSAVLTQFKTSMRS